MPTETVTVGGTKAKPDISSSREAEVGGAGGGGDGAGAGAGAGCGAGAGVGAGAWQEMLNITNSRESTSPLTRSILMPIRISPFCLKLI